MTKHSPDRSRRLAASLRSAGWKLDDIGAALGVSGERARQLLLPVAPRACRACGGPVAHRKQYHPSCRPSDRKPGSRKTPAPWRGEDLSGRTFGWWTVLRHSGSQSYWACRCGCGLERLVRASTLTGGVSRSCKSCAARRRTGAKAPSPSADTRTAAIKTGGPTEGGMATPRSTFVCEPTPECD
jgi:hypothetical protein